MIKLSFLSTALPDSKSDVLGLIRLSYMLGPQVAINIKIITIFWTFIDKSKTITSCSLFFALQSCTPSSPEG